MAFTTPTYILFLAVVFAVYWTLRRLGPQNVLLLISSYLFYLTWDRRFGVLLLVSGTIDYLLAILLGKAQKIRLRHSLLGLSILTNIGTLVFFKYFNFFSENFQLLAKSIGWRTDPTLVKVLLPVGLSFYTFKSLSYVIDVYRGRLDPTRNLVAYLTYVSFFPQILAGPIDRAGNLLRQLLAERRFSYPLAADGCRQILWGLFKKMVLADNLAPIVNLVYGEAANRPGTALLFATVCFAFQIYCDFSAYSDIAIGAGKLLGIRSGPNFAYPYFAQSPAEFWRRWHISLTSWFRDYVYFRLGGIRGSAVRKILNVMITFMLSGLWHGASWNFLIWAGLNGTAVLPAVFLKTGARPAAISKFGSFLKSTIRTSLTFGFICLTWIFFRAETVGKAFLILKKIFSDIFSATAYRSLRALLHPYPAYPLAGKTFAIFMLGFVGIEWLQRRREHPLVMDGRPTIVRWFVYQGVIFIVIYFGTYSISQFYYYQF